MAFTAEEEETVRATMEGFLKRKRPPVEIRPKLDIGYRTEGQSVIIAEYRPSFRDPDQIQELPFAKSTWNRSRGVWRLYWRRADLRWHLYEPGKEFGDLGKLLKVVEEDRFGCFFG